MTTANEMRNCIIWLLLGDHDLSRVLDELKVMSHVIVRDQAEDFAEWLGRPMTIESVQDGLTGPLVDRAFIREQNHGGVLDDAVYFVLNNNMACTPKCQYYLCACWLHEMATTHYDRANQTGLREALLGLLNAALRCDPLFRAAVAQFLRWCYCQEAIQDDRDSSVKELWEVILSAATVATLREVAPMEVRNQVVIEINRTVRATYHVSSGGYDDSVLQQGLASFKSMMLEM